ncbi:MAG: tetratricopeptide repeat protein [Bacteroidota bacterium]
MRSLFCWIVLGCCLVPAAHAQDALTQARSLIGEGEHRQAVAVLTAVADATPAHYYLLGLSYQALLQHRQALGALDQADQMNRRVLAAKGRSYDALGQTLEAINAYEGAYVQDSTHVSTASSLARLYAQRDKWRSVATIYDRLLEEDSENSTIHQNLGRAYGQLDSLERSLNHYEQARRLNPENLGVLLSLSAAYARLEYYTSAQRVVAQGIAERPLNAQLWFRSGELAMTVEDYDFAVASFDSALVRGDTSSINLRNLGVSHYLKGDYAASDAVLMRAHKSDSTDGMQTFYLGMAKKNLDQYDDALHYLDKASRLLGRDLLADLYAQIAATHDVMDDDARAIQVYRLSLNLNPAKRENLFHLAALYDTYYKDPATALETYERFLAQVTPGELPQFESYAEERVKALRERQFFREGRTAPADTSAGQD